MIGDQVVCIASEPWADHTSKLVPVVGRIYTVADESEDKGELFLRLEEIDAPGRWAQPYWDARCFRPLKRKSAGMAILQAILDGARIREDA